MAPRVKRTAKVEGDGSELLTERVNVDLLQQVAQSRQGCWIPQAGGPRLRTVLADILACCESDGCLTSAWREEPLAVNHGVLGRRYSGLRASGEPFQY